jgi:hypothetical protein
MRAADVIAALELPRSTRVDQRVAKKLLVENGAATPADRRRINEGIEELVWVAALKPHTIGVPAFRDDVREYLEVAVLSVSLRSDAQHGRLVELIHRAIPYPLLLIATQVDTVTLSATHKRNAQNEAGKVVLEVGPSASGVTEAELPASDASPTSLPPLNLSAQPRANLWALYQGWLECLEAIQAAQITGRVALAGDAVVAEARRAALADHHRLVGEIAALRSKAERESQLPRRVELNMAVKNLESQLASAISQL